MVLDDSNTSYYVWSSIKEHKEVDYLTINICCFCHMTSILKYDYAILGKPVTMVYAELGLLKH